MTTRAPTARQIEVPNLVGVKAHQAIETLRELRLMPITWSTTVDDVSDAGNVLGLDPPPGTPVRPQAHVTISVATHPDFQGHADDDESAPPVQPPLTWPLSSPAGFAPPAAAVAHPFQTAAAPGVAPAPASPPLDAAYKEIRHDDAAASSAIPPAPGAAADLYYPDDMAAPVPTPDQIAADPSDDQIAADSEWDRLRAAEAALHTADPNRSTEPVVPRATAPAAAVVDATAQHDTARELEEQARRDARRRSARRHRRLTPKQKLLVGAVLALTLLLIGASMSGRTPVAHRQTTADTAKPQRRHPASRAAVTAPVTHKPAAVRTRRVVVYRTRTRTRTRVVKVFVRVPAPSNPSPSASSSADPVNYGSSTPAAATTGAGMASQIAAAPSPSHLTASSPSSADSRSSGTGGGSTLQAPDGTTAPPQP